MNYIYKYTSKIGETIKNAVENRSFPHDEKPIGHPIENMSFEPSQQLSGSPQYNYEHDHPNAPIMSQYNREYIENVCRQNDYNSPQSNNQPLFQQSQMSTFIPVQSMRTIKETSNFENRSTFNENCESNQSYQQTTDCDYESPVKDETNDQYVGHIDNFNSDLSSEIQPDNYVPDPLMEYYSKTLQTQKEHIAEPEIDPIQKQEQSVSDNNHNRSEQQEQTDFNNDNWSVQREQDDLNNDNQQESTGDQIKPNTCIIHSNRYKNDHPMRKLNHHLLKRTTPINSDSIINQIDSPSNLLKMDSTKGIRKKNVFYHYVDVTYKKSAPQQSLGLYIENGKRKSRRNQNKSSNIGKIQLTRPRRKVFS